MAEFTEIGASQAGAEGGGSATTLGSGGVGGSNTLASGGGGGSTTLEDGGLGTGSGGGGSATTLGSGGVGSPNTLGGLRTGSGGVGGSNTLGGLREPLSRLGAILPQPGDLIATNYGWKFGDVHEVLSVHRDPEIPGAWCFEARNVRTPGRQWPLGRTIWLHGYRRSAGGRLLGNRYRPGMAGWLAQDHGFPWNDLGYDEIMVIRRCAQPPLFPFGAGPAGGRSA